MNNTLSPGLINSLLVESSINGNDGRVSELLKAGANPNTKSGGFPLCEALRYGHFRTAEILLKHGANCANYYEQYRKQHRLDDDWGEEYY